jgi:glycosyltransferase involved in cell wall biosynthesis
MISKQTTVTIGIPAFNEETNIGNLLNILLLQKQTDFIIKKIIINNDGSKDKTADIVKHYKCRKIALINNTERKGINYRLNQILKLTTTDILVILNADIVPLGKTFVANLIRPITTNEADITSAKSIPIYPISFFKKVLYEGEEFKADLFELINSGNNIYTCRGTARAFRNILYRQLFFIQNTPDDAYSYLWSKVSNFRYQFCKDSVLIYQLPGNYSDYRKQGERFVNYQFNLKKHFSNNFISQQYVIPKTLLLKIFFSAFYKSPVYISFYLLTWFSVSLQNKLFKRKATDLWQISSTTKSFSK